MRNIYQGCRVSRPVLMKIILLLLFGCLTKLNVSTNKTQDQIYDSIMSQDFWRDEPQRSVFRSGRKNALNPRYEVIDGAQEHDDWSPHNWVGKVKDGIQCI